MERFKDVAALIGRLVVGIVFIAHGAQKFFQFGIGGTTKAFTGMGVPMPGLSAWFAATVELVGGALFLLGAALPVAAALLVVDMVGALVIVDLQKGLLGGYELPLLLAASALALGLNGGKYTLDNLVFKNRKTAAVSA
jgi:putative oxidoreductase